MDGENGLLLTPTVDHLFDKGFISFENTGQLIVSPVADPVSLKRMGIDRDRQPNVGAFSLGQRGYLGGGGGEGRGGGGGGGGKGGGGGWRRTNSSGECVADGEDQHPWLIGPESVLYDRCSGTTRLTRGK